MAESEVDVLADADKELFDVYQVINVVLCGPRKNPYKRCSSINKAAQLSMGFVKHNLADKVS